MPLPILIGAALPPRRKPRKVSTAPSLARMLTMAKTSPGEFLRQVRSEASKIYWPSRQETVTTAIFVGILTTVLALFFMGIDSAFGAAVRWALSLV